MDIAGLSDRWESDARANEAGASLIGADGRNAGVYHPETATIHAESAGPTESRKFRGSEAVSAGICEVR